MKKEIDKELFFCSAASRYFKEQLAGTAANSNTFILIEHFNPFPEKIIQAHFDKTWLQEILDLAKQLKGKVLLIRNKHTNFNDCKITFVDCKQCLYCTIETTLKKAPTIQLADYINAANTQWRGDPFFVICTNGKKDKCCAKFGYTVYKFFESFNANIDVWECSHVGGDRFAANVVAMPFGIYYGHVGVEDVGHIMVRTLLRKIYKNKFRGLSRRSFCEQAIECYLREHLQNYDIDFEIHLHLIHHQNDFYTANITTHPMRNNYTITIRREKIDYPHFLTCKSSKKENLSKFQLVHLTAI